VLDTKGALEDSTLGLFNSPATIRAAKARTMRNGIVTGEEMASGLPVIARAASTAVFSAMT